MCSIYFNEWLFGYFILDGGADIYVSVPNIQRLFSAFHIMLIGLVFFVFLSTNRCILYRFYLFIVVVFYYLSCIAIIYHITPFHTSRFYGLG